MPYDSPKGIIAASAILELLSASCVVARFVSRRRQKPSFGIDDWLILASLVGATGLTVTEIYGVAIGVLARPLMLAIEDPRAIGSRVNKIKHVELGVIAVDIPTLGLIRISISFLYRRIFGHKKHFRRMIDGWILVTILWTVAFEIAALARCGSHLDALFGTPQAYLHRCGSTIPSGYAMVVSSILSDFITLLLPLPMIWSLHMDLHRKVLLILTFMIGLLSCGAGIGKAYIYVQASRGISHLDGILTMTGFTVWNLIEVHVGIIAACGVLLRPLLLQILPTDSLKSLVHSLRRRISSTRFSFGSQRLASRGNSAHQDVSNEELVLSRPRAGNAELRAVATTEGGKVAGEGDFVNGEIYIKRQIEVEEA